MTNAGVRLIQELETVEEFCDALRRELPLVITDTTGRNHFHQAPWACGHVLEDNFRTKVIENGRRNGSYFAATSFGEAQDRWPSLTRCF